MNYYFFVIEFSFLLCISHSESIDILFSISIRLLGDDFGEWNHSKIDQWFFFGLVSIEKIKIIIFLAKCPYFLDFEIIWHIAN